MRFGWDGGMVAWWDGGLVGWWLGGMEVGGMEVGGLSGMEENKKSGGGNVRAEALAWNDEWDKA